jgi:hypothetical protein
LRAAAHPSHPQLPGELGAETPDGHEDTECDKRDPGEASPVSDPDGHVIKALSHS